jgi:hypothetical protein
LHKKMNAVWSGNLTATANRGPRALASGYGMMPRMRIRITMPMKGEIDGIDLTRFQVGQVYDMGPSLANYLMASGYAMPVVDEKPALVVPLGDEGVVELGGERSNPRNGPRPSTKLN